MIFHPALDLAAALLRAFGRYGLATDKRSAEELDTLCGQWARHLLIGAPAPDATGATTDTARREWEQARRFFTDARRSEQELLNTLISAFATCCGNSFKGSGRLFVNEQTAGQAVASQPDHMKQALAPIRSTRCAARSWTV